MIRTRKIIIDTIRTDGQSVVSIQDQEQNWKSVPIFFIFLLIIFLLTASYYASISAHSTAIGWPLSADHQWQASDAAVRGGKAGYWKFQENNTHFLNPM